MFSLEAEYFNVILFDGAGSNMRDIFSSDYFFLNQTLPARIFPFVISHALVCRPSIRAV